MLLLLNQGQRVAKKRDGSRILAPNVCDVVSYGYEYFRNLYKEKTFNYFLMFLTSIVSIFTGFLSITINFYQFHNIYKTSITSMKYKNTSARAASQLPCCLSFEVWACVNEVKESIPARHNVIILLNVR